MKIILYLGVLLCLLSILPVSFVNGQGSKSNQGGLQTVITINSDILKESRKVSIFAPKAADETDKRCPVLYVLDAESHFSLLVEYSKLLSKDDVGLIPPLIIVGIHNTDRIRDLTPSKSNVDYYGNLDTTPNSWLKNSGGNELFFQFLEKEVKPYIKTNFSTHPYSIFAGHSFGALTVTNCMFIQPDNFNAFIAASPSLWWDQKYMLIQAERKLTQSSKGSKTLFICDGNEGVTDKSTFHDDILKFRTLLEGNRKNNLEYHYSHYPEESHNSIPIKSYYDALRFIFQNWKLAPISDDEVNSKIVMTHYKALSQRFT